MEHEDNRLACCAARRQSTEEEECALLALVSAGDRAAMEELYVLYFARLADFFLHLTTQRDLVDELIDDTMVEVWQRGASLAASTSVSVAIMRLAYSFGRKRVIEASETRPHLRHAIQNTDHDGSLSLDTASNKQDWFLNLPSEERALLHLVYARGHSRREIGEIMNISCECVDVQLGDTRRRRHLSQ